MLFPATRAKSRSNELTLQLLHRIATLILIALPAYLSICASNKVLCADKSSVPNIVLILADDQGYGDVSHAGGLAATPHIDRLASEGMRFTDAHTTSSVCTPTRYSILTGRYNWRSPLKKGVLWGLSKPLIPKDRSTAASFLRKHGYHTGIVGKWHLGLGWKKLPNGEKRKASHGPTKGKGWDIDYTKTVTGGPNALGFDESFIIPASLDMDPYVYLRNGLPTQQATVTKAFHRAGPSGKDFEAVNCLRDFARESRTFIANNAKKPFFLYVPLTSPHTPIVPSPNWKGKSTLGKYGDFVMETDWVVGEILAELDKQKLTGKTLVLFATDNGCSPAAGIPALIKKGHRPNAHWRGHKADIFEGGHRVPFIVRWPGVAKAGSRSDQLVSTVDFFATTADIVGARDDIAATEAEDSFSFLPILKGEDKAIRSTLIHHSIGGQFAIRRGKWKLSLCPGSGGWSQPKPNVALRDDKLPPVQLYDLETDPSEANNVQDKHPELVNELVDALAAAIRNGRTTPGPAQANDGWPNTIPKKVLTAYPKLKPSAPKRSVDDGALDNQAQAGSIKVTCVGDSNTRRGYPEILEGLLGQGWKTTNCGISAATIIDGTFHPYLEEKIYQVALGSEPDFVIIMLGTNDANPKWWKGKRKTKFKGTPAEEFRAGYLKLIDSFQQLKSRPQVIIALPLPVFVKNPPSRRRREVLINQVCPLMRAIAKEQKLPLVDLQTIMAGDVELSEKDGVHFTKQGYEKMSKAFKERILDLKK